MTREEAIKVLKKNRPSADPRQCGLELCTAVDVAIAALREQETVTICHHLEPVTIYRTNADHIRSMTDEELAEFIEDVFETGRISVFAIYPELTKNRYGMDWLNQPKEET